MLVKLSGLQMSTTPVSLCRMPLRSPRFFVRRILCRLFSLQFLLENLCSALPCEVCGAGLVHMESIGALFALGLVARVAAFLALVFTNRHKQV